MQNRVLFLARNKDVQSCFQSGVSLHGHTRHSLENLGFLGRFLAQHRSLRAWIAHQSARCKRGCGITLDFNQAYWTPPLPGRLAFELEHEQIAALGLRPMVSLSDHNNIEAASLLRMLPGQRDLPISVEWTVPFGQAVFHIGVHNLPARMAEEMMTLFRESSARGDERELVGILADLCRIPAVLLVFNHPVWNFNGIAPEIFDHELKRFLQAASPSLHAFELNGMRGHRENRRVVKLASEWNQVVISGGDRHACEPNALLNVTQATDFSEFAEEIRSGRQSTILVMPQYEEPLNWRIYRSFTQVVQEYPNHPEGQRTWDERTFHPDLSGEVVCLKQLWHHGAPRFLTRIFALAILAGSAPAHWLVRAVISGEETPLIPPQHPAVTQRLDPAVREIDQVSSLIRGAAK